MNKLFSFFLLLGIGVTCTFSQWNPQAGVVVSLTDNATITSSSVGSNLSYVLDNDVNTSWQSDAPLPSGFLSRADQNYIYQQGATLCTGTGSSYANITDGDANTASNFSMQNGRAMLKMDFGAGTSMYSASMKLSVGAGNPVEIYAFTSAIDSVLIGTFTDANSYTLQRYNFPANVITALKLYSNNGFQAFELGIMAKLPQEWVVIDLGTAQNIGQIITRHWDGGGPNASATDIYLSVDNVNWTHITSLVPDALQPITTQVLPNINARYLKVAHTLIMADWNKVFLWEIDAFGATGQYGAFPTPTPSLTPFREVLGVNGIWGWGHNIGSSALGINEGPRLYNAAARHARNYHAMDWDVTDPDIKPDYVTMAAGGGTQGQWWLNWDDEYVEWVNAGLEIQASVQFLYPAAAWDSAYEAAYDYGFAFAKHFGPTFGTGHVGMMEVGNEPWSYDSILYRTILRGMAKGAKDADPAMKVIPCALQAGDPYSDLVSWSQNYMGTRVTETEAPYLDGLNVHAYSYINNNQGVRVETYPENPTSTMLSILPAIHFRDENMPGKQIYWSEFGWDTDGAGEACTHNECVSERAGTAYAVRAAMMGWRWGIDRMTWFFYANDINGSSLYSRSGLTGSKNGSFQKKTIFTAFEALLYNIEDLYFLDVLQEDSTAWIYVLGDSSGNATHLMAWRPIQGDNTSLTNVPLTSVYMPISAVKLEGLSAVGESISTPSYNNGTMNLSLGAVPILVAIQKTTDLAENISNPSLIIAPNPVEKQCVVQCSEAIERLIIWDNLGRKVYEKSANPQTHSLNIDTANFPQGLYVCEVITAKQRHLSQKIWVK